MVAHLHFFQTHKGQQKNAKEPPDTPRQKERQPVKRVWQKWRFSAPQTHLWFGF